MENNKKTKLEEIIKKRIGAIKIDIAAYELLAKPISPDNAIGRLTRMGAINSKSINEAALNTSKETLSNLKHALAKIDRPDFGLCKECEEPIPLIDIGAVMQNICLAALDHGLGTCIEDQGVMYPEVLREFTDIADNRRIVIAIAIGYPDPDFPANRLVSAREPIDSITQWIGFQE